MTEDKQDKQHTASVNVMRLRFSTVAMDKRQVTNIMSLFQYISNKIRLYTVNLHLETSLHVSGGISTHHQEHTQLYLQYLVLSRCKLIM